MVITYNAVYVLVGGLAYYVAKNQTKCPSTRDSHTAMQTSLASAPTRNLHSLGAIGLRGWLAMLLVYMNSCCSQSEHQRTGSAQPFPDGRCAVSTQSWGTHSALQTPRLQTCRGWPFLKQKGFRVETASFSLAAAVPYAAETHAGQGCRDMKVLVGIVLWP